MSKDFSAELSTACVLLVEDDPHDAIAFKRTIAKALREWKVTRCQASEKAIELLLDPSNSYDVVVADFMLPGMNGLELCQKIIALELKAPTVILTGEGNEETAVRALRLGINDYIIKDHRQGYLAFIPEILKKAIKDKSARNLLREKELRLQKTNRTLRKEVAERKRAEEGIQKLNEDLERRVDERTSALHQLSGRLISAQEDERSRIARELHDDFIQRLSLLSVDLERLQEGSSISQESHTNDVTSLLWRTKELASDLQRLSHQLHPSMLQHLGLVVATKSICKEISEQYDIDIEFTHHEVPRSLPSDTALCLYRIIQEALRNVIKHSGTESARVEITGTASEVKLLVSDDGIGFDPYSDKKNFGLGLLSMRERLRLVDGTISIMRIEPSGTRIDIRIPFSESNEQ